MVGGGWRGGGGWEECSSSEESPKAIYIFIESQVKKVKNSKPENAVICHML